MLLECKNGRCETPRWMGRALAAAGIYHLLFAVWTNAWPHHWFDWCAMEQPNHPMLWRGVGLLTGALGIGFLIAARNPVRHWLIVLVGFTKVTLGCIGFAVAIFHRDLPLCAVWTLVIDDFIWWPFFAGILWSTVQAYAGVPPMRRDPLPVGEAAEAFRLSSGETLAEASRSQTLALVFLRHFGCTFTRQILRGLQALQKEAEQNGARLVLVHMLRDGEETGYLGERSGVARIADPRCELYRSFGLGKGGFFELFGPRVWWRGAVSIFKGCGLGHLAGDGLQMPGAFLYRNGRVLASQPARSAADLPDLPGLFAGLQPESARDTLPA